MEKQSERIKRVLEGISLVCSLVEKLEKTGEAFQIQTKLKEAHHWALDLKEHYIEKELKSGDQSIIGESKT